MSPDSHEDETREEAIALQGARSPWSLKSPVRFKIREVMLGSTFLPKEKDSGHWDFFWMGSKSGEWGEREARAGQDPPDFPR